MKLSTSIKVLMVLTTCAVSVVIILMCAYREAPIVLTTTYYTKITSLANGNVEPLYTLELQSFKTKKLPDTIQERNKSEPEAIQESTIIMPDCMAFNRTESGSSQHHNKITNLCKVFNGTTRTYCIYKHPNVVKYVKFATNLSAEEITLSFRDYLSIHSVNRFYKPDKIIIYSNHDDITGKYWKLANNLSTPIEVRHTGRITSIGKKHSKPGYISHEADYFKVLNGLKEGGVFSDFDVIILNGTRFREMQMKSELVLGRDNNPCDRVCAGFFSVVPGSKFMKKWLDGYENDYRTHHWWHNAGGVPAKILRDCPWCYDVTVDPHMSNWDEVPNWGKKLDWKKKAVAHYMRITQFMKPIKEPKDLLNTSTPLADMFRFVLGDTLHEITQL